MQGFLAGGTLFLLLGAWITHIITCLLTGKYLLLLVGAIVAPVGMLHGVGIWFGVQW